MTGAQQNVVELPPGNSLEQQAAESVMLRTLSDELGVQLQPQNLTASGRTVAIDGVSTDRPVLVECWAHQGRARGAQRNKALIDATKLHWIDEQLRLNAQLIFCYSDAAAVAHLQGRSWQRAAIDSFNVELRLISVDEATVRAVLTAQRRQFR